MQIRLLACVAGGLLGIAATVPANNILGLNPTIALISCSSIGIALGYVVSMLVDVFAPSHRGRDV